jgi:hypothetical protein
MVADGKEDMPRFFLDLARRIAQDLGVDERVPTIEDLRRMASGTT